MILSERPAAAMRASAKAFCSEDSVRVSTVQPVSRTARIAWAPHPEPAQTIKGRENFNSLHEIMT